MSKKDFSVSGVRAIPAEMLSRPANRTSKYQKIMDNMKRLRAVGEGFEINPPEGVPFKVFANRITTLLMGHPVDPPKGLRFSKHITKKGTVVVLLTAVKK